MTHKMMADEKILKLIKRLAELTDQNKISWAEAERGGAFLASFSGNSASISVRQSRQNSGQSEYVLRILNDWGDVIEEVGDEDFEGQDVYQTMKMMFEKARRISLGLDEAIDSILKQLDEVDDQPF